MPLRVRDYRRVVEFAAGDTASRHLIFGGMSREEEGEQWQLAQLRIGYLGAELGEPVTATVKLADGGSMIGPLDLPILIGVEEPPEVILTPGKLLSAVTIVLSLTPITAECGRVGNVTIDAVAATAYPLPQWVRAVSAGVAGTYQYRDRATGLLSAASGDLRPRPCAAADVLVVAAGPLTLWY
jgi:hypothetical protein